MPRNSKACHFFQPHSPSALRAIEDALARGRTPARALTVSFAQSTEEVDDLLDQEALDRAENERIACELERRQTMDRPVLLVFCPAYHFCAVA